MSEKARTRPRRVTKTIRDSKKTCLQGQPGDRNLRSTRGIEPEANCIINAPRKGFQTQFSNYYLANQNITMDLIWYSLVTVTLFSSEG